MRRSRRQDTGQTSAEYMAVVGIAVVLVLAVIVVAPGFGTRIGAAIAAAICRITGGTCTTTSELAEPQESCKVYQQTQHDDFGITVFSVHLGTGQTLKEVRTADGKYAVELSGEGSAAFKIGEGGDVQVNAGQSKGGGGDKADFQVGITGGGGAEWEFDSTDEAKKFMSWAQDQFTTNSVDTFVPAYGFVKGAWHWLFGGYDPPKPNSTFYEGGLTASASVTSGEGAVGGSAEASVSAVIGVNVTDKGPQKGAKTIYFNVSADGKAAIGSMFGVGASGSLQGDAIISVSYDPKGKPTELKVESAGSATGGASAPSLGSGQFAGDISSAIKDLSVQAGSNENGLGIEMVATLDLVNQQNLDAASNALHSLGIPILNGSGTGSTPPPVAMNALFNRFTQGDGAHVGLTSYDVSTQNWGISGGAADGIDFDAEAGLQIQTEKLRGAQYYVPGQGFVTWKDCTSGK